MIRRSAHLLKPVLTGTGISRVGKVKGQAQDGGFEFVGTLGNLKGTVLETIARNMPEQERAFFAHRWGFSTPISRDDEKEAGAVSDLGGATSPTVVAIATDNVNIGGVGDVQSRDGGEGIHPSESVAKEKMKAGEPEIPVKNLEVDEDKVATIVIHPILGQLVADLKYKRVYRTSIEALVKAPVWEKQRILRPERAQAIANAKLKQGSGPDKNGIPGVITLYSRPPSIPTAKAGAAPTSASSTASGTDDEADDIGELGIVDGQHRVGALMLMAERGSWNRTERNIVIDVFPTHSEEEVAALFTEINSGEPVRLVDMPVEGATDEVRTILNEAAAKIEEQFFPMFKTSSRCRPPHLNADSFRDEIFQSDLIERHGLKTTPQLLNWLLKVNETLGRRGEEKWREVSDGKNRKTFSKALTKAQEHNFYLGMDKSWLHV